MHSFRSLMFGSLITATAIYIYNLVDVTAMPKKVPLGPQSVKDQLLFQLNVEKYLQKLASIILKQNLIEIMKFNTLILVAFVCYHYNLWIIFYQFFFDKASAHKEKQFKYEKPTLAGVLFFESQQLLIDHQLASASLLIDPIDNISQERSIKSSMKMLTRIFIPTLYYNQSTIFVIL